MPEAPKKKLSNKKPSKKKPVILSENLFPVVGIGASAGGLEAFKKLLKSIPEKSGMAYVIVQHLHPEHTSALPQILQRETNVPVHEISNNVEIAPDNIYIIPTNKMLAATDGILKLSPRPNDQKNMPIDIFFTSLAHVHQSHAIGVILSGNGADGTKGLKSIKDHGGITFAQEPANAAYGNMPQSAIDAGVVDFILVPEKMPQQLLELDKTINKAFSAAKPASPEELTEEESYRQVLSLLRMRSGVDFTYYKQTTIRRRILRRMALLKIEKTIDYQEYLKQNKQEQDLLFKDILIPVTEFFRDPKTFEFLGNTVFPELIKNSQSNTLRIWIAGCSTGEEAYSVGICLYEYLSDEISDTRIQIFATDISEESIATARAGVYTKRQLEGVSDRRLQQFFTRTDGHYHVKKTIRDMCVFATHNFLKDPPFAKIDLITCRNVLIYMEPFLQKKALTTFHYALNGQSLPAGRQGYLLLGKSETTGSTDLFLATGGKEKLFTRKLVPGRFMNVASERKEERLKDRDYAIRSSEQKKDNFQKNADDILLSKYTPPGVIVDEQFDIVQFRGQTGEFLEPSPGKASLNLLKMAREGLSFELRNALHKSKTSNETFIKEGIPIHSGKKLVTIEVIPLLNTIELHFLILFREQESSREYQVAGEKTRQNNKTNDTKDAGIAQLEKELLQAREDMRSITEDQEAANEELQSANEELLSGSEELQTLNEELETSKEELQSTNEELITVNQELFDRNEQYNHARLYAEAIVTTIHEPLLVLTKDFRVRSANPAFYKLFQLTEEETINKILFELEDHGWQLPDLREQIIKVQTQSEKSLDGEIRFTFPKTGKKIIHYNARPVQKENEQSMVLLAMEDVTERESASRKIEESEERFHLMAEMMPAKVTTAYPEGGVTYYNKSWLDYTGMSFEELQDFGYHQIMHPDEKEEFQERLQEAAKTGHVMEMEMRFRNKEGKYRWHLNRAFPLMDNNGKVKMWIGATTDIQEQKRREEEKTEFINIASHELKTPLTTLKLYINLLHENVTEIDLSRKGNQDENLLFIQKAGIAVGKLEMLIGELLDVNKMQEGKLGYDITTFDFDKMLDEAIEETQLSTPAYKIFKSGNIELEFKGDKGRLQQVVNNLLSNAIKYSPGSNEVFVTVTKEKDTITVAVRDRGVGIKQENLHKIFDLYFRETELARSFNGFGIGLSICNEIIHRHNGEIWAESQPGEGSTFYFTLPI